MTVSEMTIREVPGYIEQKQITDTAAEEASVSETAPLPVAV